jgi:SAM-dependent methyltransferase
MSTQVTANTEEVWWRNFFSGVALDVWRQLRTDGNTRPEADFVERAARLTKGAHILDVPCGAARICLELSSKGYRTTGVDLSEDFLLEARTAAIQRNIDISLECRDMRDLPWVSEFDAACCFGISFGYMDDQGNRDFVEAVFKTLKPGGAFIIDTNKILEIVLPSFEKRRWVKLEDILLLFENRYDHVSGRLHTEYTFIRDGTQETRFTSQRVYSYRELCTMLRGVGFSLVESYSSLKMEPLMLGSQRLLLVATK